ncbi:hypothetical protein [Candidatus Proelusimicrobium excrementi]|uniref:hypothetical protein n=1 Tax=Candidatus Proelusimicrobium excrementi TaxID=3416222 RepID=UPI003D114242
MNINYEQTKDNDLCVGEIDSLISNLDIDEITSGINRSLEDIKRDRYMDIDTCLERTRKRRI